MLYIYIVTMCKTIFWLLSISVIIVLAVGIIYVYQNKNNSTFKDVGSYQQYFLDPLAYNPNNPNNFNNSIYSLPGSTADPYMLYGTGYMPYESAVPAVDVMRANNNKVLPQYYMQYLRENTTPFANRGY